MISYFLTPFTCAVVLPPPAPPLSLAKSSIMEAILAIPTSAASTLLVNERSWYMSTIGPDSPVTLWGKRSYIRPYWETGIICRRGSPKETEHFSCHQFAWMLPCLSNEQCEWKTDRPRGFHQIWIVGHLRQLLVLFFEVLHIARQLWKCFCRHGHSYCWHNLLATVGRHNHYVTCKKKTLSWSFEAASDDSETGVQWGESRRSQFRFFFGILSSLYHFNFIFVYFLFDKKPLELTCKRGKLSNWWMLLLSGNTCIIFMITRKYNFYTNSLLESSNNFIKWNLICTIRNYNCRQWE